MVNKVMLIGNLTGKPEIKTTSTGGVVALLNLATNESWTDKASGERKTKAEFHRVTVWNKLGENVQKLDLDTGTQLYIEGQLTHRSYDAPNGEKKYVTEVKLSGFGSELRILSKKNNNPDVQNSPSVPVVTPITPVAAEEFEDDIPF